MSLTAELGAFVAGIRYEALPAEALSIVRRAFTDTVGVMLLGTFEPVTAAIGFAQCLSADLISAPNLSRPIGL